MPIGEADTFSGIIDLLSMKAEIYKDDLGQNIEVTEIPAELKDKAEQLRAELIEKVVETDVVNKEHLLNDKYILVQKGKKNYYLIIAD
jgi:elongation factor G